MATNEFYCDNILLNELNSKKEKFMKKIAFCALATSLIAFNYSYAQGEMHCSSHASGHSNHGSAADSKEVTISGQLVGLTCLIKHDSKGASHKDCFKECAEKGLPIGILTKENKIYQISGEGHADLSETNKKFLKYAEEEVIVKGAVFTSNGMNMIVVKGIKKAN